MNDKDSIKPEGRNSPLNQSNAALLGSILLANTFAREDLAVEAGDSFSKKALLAFPSILIAPDLTGNNLIDTSIMGLTALFSLEAVRKTSTNQEILITGIGSQILGCILNSSISELFWLKNPENNPKDVGFSSISVAWITKYLLDRMDSSRSDKESSIMKTCFKLFAGISTIGPYFVEDSRSAILDSLSHISGLLVGYMSYRSRNKNSIKFNENYII